MSLRLNGRAITVITVTITVADVIIFFHDGTTVGVLLAVSYVLQHMSSCTAERFLLSSHFLLTLGFEQILSERHI